MKNTEDSGQNTYGYGFPRTRATLFSTDEAARECALTELVQQYREALVRYLGSDQRKRGGLWVNNATWVAEVVDAFIAEKFWKIEFLSKARRSAGQHFRPFLKTAFYNFAVDEYRKADRRGGVEQSSPKDPESYNAPAAADTDKDPEFDILWARELLTLALERMRTVLAEKVEHQIRWEVFARCRLMPILGGAEEEPTASTIQHVKSVFGREMTSDEVSLCRHRGAKTFYRHVVDLLSETCTDHEQIEEELRYFIQLLRGGLRLKKEQLKTYTPPILDRQT